MIDENAFGVFIALFDATNLEYAVSVDEYARLLLLFRAVVREGVAEAPWLSAAQPRDFGTAVYFERTADDPWPTSPIAWLRELREEHRKRGVVTLGVVTCGSRWDSAELEPLGMPIACSSEPLRKALAVEACAAAGLVERDAEGWGPGLYVESDAITALGRTLKNTPTAFYAATGEFYRLSG